MANQFVSLPFNESPPVQTYSHHSHILGILMNGVGDGPHAARFSHCSVKGTMEPSGWHCLNLSSSEDGNVEMNGDTFAFHPPVGDITGTRDTCQFVYRRLLGDGELTVRVDYIKNTSVWAKAGLMVRQSLAPDAPNAAIVLTPSHHGVRVQFRDQPGGITHDQKAAPALFPLWLKMSVSDGVIRAHVSSDNENWRLVWEKKDMVSGDCFIGMVATAWNNAYLDWIFCNYIQLGCTRDFTSHLDLPVDFFLGIRNFDRNYHVNTPLINSQKINRNLINKGFKDIVDFVKQAIDMRYYVDVILNERYVPDREAYGWKDFPHGNLITGYSDADEVFEVAGYDQHKRFKKMPVSYDTFRTAYYACDYVDENIFLYGISEYSEYAFDLSVIVNQLDMYLNARSPYKNYGLHQNERDDLAFGVEVYECIKKNFGMGYRCDDLRPLNLLWEHKRMMQLRIDYLHFEKKCLSKEDYQYFRLEFDNIEKKAFLLRNMQIKYQKTSDKELINRIITELDSMKNVEMAVLRQMLVCLKQVLGFDAKGRKQIVRS